MAPGVEWLELPAELGDPPETGESFVANALEKASWVHARTGLPALADDSGLEVEALGGHPGVRSRRYSPEATDEANNRKLLAELGDRGDRRAAYRCAIAIVGLGNAHISIGSCEGQILRAPRGRGGFGYDPLFLPDATTGRSMAELSAAEKDGISHRGAALRQSLRWLEAIDLPDSRSS